MIDTNIRNESIVGTMLKSFGFDEDNAEYDSNQIVDTLLPFINMAIGTLSQICSSLSPVYVTDSSTTWNDLYSGDNDEMMTLIVADIVFRTKLLWDAPDSSYVLSAYEKRIDELDWRLSIAKG